MLLRWAQSEFMNLKADGLTAKMRSEKNRRKIYCIVVPRNI